MKWLGSTSCVWLLALCMPVSCANQTAESADIKWARGLATDFLDALLSRDASQVAAAAMLVAPEFRAGAEGAEGKTFAYLWGLRTNFQSCTFRSAETAPSGKEIVFRGKLEAREDSVGTAEPLEAEFTIRVAEEVPNGKWSIRFLHIKPKPR